MRRSQICWPQPVEYTHSIRKIWRPLPIQIRKENDTIRAGSDTPDGLVELCNLPSEQLTYMFGRHSHIHRADQGQPVIRAIAKSGNFSLWIDHRLSRKGVYRA